jgi:hypothetical protein
MQPSLFLVPMIHHVTDPTGVILPAKKKSTAAMQAAGYAPDDAYGWNEGSHWKEMIEASRISKKGIAERP